MRTECVRCALEWLGVHERLGVHRVAAMLWLHGCMGWLHGCAERVWARTLGTLNEDGEAALEEGDHAEDVVDEEEDVNPKELRSVRPSTAHRR